jgi:hypothetical protein
MKQRFKNVKGKWSDDGMTFGGVAQRVGSESNYDGTQIKGGHDDVLVVGNIDTIIKEYNERENKRLRRWAARRNKVHAERAQQQSKTNDHG